MILIIDNYDSFTYNLYQGIAQLYSDIKVIRHDQITVEQVHQMNLSGIILSPGPGRPENAGICIDLIRSLDGKIPLLGVCLGHQAIACAFGGRVIQAPEIVHGKQDEVFHCQNSLYRDLPLPFQAGRYHSLLVERSNLPDELMVQSVNAKGLVMGLRHRRLPIYGVQFHPESILTPEGFKIFEQFVDECRKGENNETKH